MYLIDKKHGVAHTVNACTCSYNHTSHNLSSFIESERRVLVLTSGLFTAAALCFQQMLTGVSEW